MSGSSRSPFSAPDSTAPPSSLVRPMALAGGRESASASPVDDETGILLSACFDRCHAMRCDALRQPPAKARSGAQLRTIYTTTINNKASPALSSLSPPLSHTSLPSGRERVRQSVLVAAAHGGRIGRQASRAHLYLARLCLVASDLPPASGNSNAPGPKRRTKHPIQAPWEALTRGVGCSL